MLELLTGSGLAMAAGLNAYLPLLILGALDRYTGVVNLPSAWDWLSEPAALGVIAVLLVIELVADKIPAVDHVNDIAQTVVRPAAGGIVFGAGSSAETSSISDPASIFTTQLWLPIALGVATAFAVHLAKATLRPIINVTTLGLGAPVISSVEDALSLAVSFIAILLPALIIGVFLALLILFIMLWRRRAASVQ